MAKSRKRLIAGNSRPLRHTYEPLVSVIIPTYNRPAMLLRAVNSVIGQSYNRLQIVVVNDAGADVAGKLPRDPRISYVRAEVNGGLAAARNLGIQHSSGEIVCLLDDDDYYYADHVQVIVDNLLQRGALAVYTDAYRIHQRYVRGQYVEVGRDVPYSREFDHLLITVENFIPVLCLGVVRSVFDWALFDASLPVLEDWEWLLRVSRAIHLIHVPKVTCAYTWRADGSTMSSSRDEQFLATTRRIYEQYAHEAHTIPEVARARAHVIANYETRLAAAQRANAILGMILSTPDPIKSAAEFSDALGEDFWHFVDARWQSAERNGDSATAKALADILEGRKAR